MTRSHHRVTSPRTAPLRHIGRNLVAYLALFLALGGTSLAAGKLLTGADIQDDSLTGADIVETSLAEVSNAVDADQLGGTAASSFLKTGTIAGGDLTGTYPAPELHDGAAAGNVWGKDQWAHHTATQRGYLYIEYDDHGYGDGSFGGDVDLYGSISYPVPLGPSQAVESHFIRSGDETRVEGCGGTMAQPTAAPGHLCVFYYPWAGVGTLKDGTYPPGNNPIGDTVARYGRKLVLTCNAECTSAFAEVVWAMTPPLPQR